VYFLCFQRHSETTWLPGCRRISAARSGGKSLEILLFCPVATASVKTVCRAGGRSSRSDPPRNLALKNLRVLLTGEEPESSRDSLHSEKLKLFCLDHQQPMCLVCRDSEEHTDHGIRPIDEAALQLAKKLRETLGPLKEKMKVSKRVKQEFDQTAEHMRVQARRTERQIKDQFKKLHQFLEEEEEARMAALREEEEQKTQMIKEKMEALSREIEALSDHRGRLVHQQLRGCRGTSPAAPPAGGPTAGTWL